MGQVSYGTITITDTNDIEKIYMQYCRSTSSSLNGGTDVPNKTVGWQDTTPAWKDGEYIWQRAVVQKSGTGEKSYGTPVCVTGAQGDTGEPGRSLKSTTTQYTTATASATITESNMGSYTWSADVPTYNANTPAYWVRITNTYENPTKTEYVFYKDNGISDAIKTSHDANSTAASASSKADNAVSTAGQAKTIAEQAQSNLAAYQSSNDTRAAAIESRAKYFWWDSEGAHIASGVSPTMSASNTDPEPNRPSTFGFNALTAPGALKLRRYATDLAVLDTGSLSFYIPPSNWTATSPTGPKAMELTAQGLYFYQPNVSNNKMMELTGSALKFYDANGINVQATFGGSQATISGTINAYDGQIGNSEDNYWYIGNYTDYFQNTSAAIKSHGTAFIQLGDSNTWRLATNRIHTAWNDDSESGDAFRLHFLNFNQKYWDLGLHLPTVTNGTLTNNKFLYIRNAPNTQTLENLGVDLEDSGYDYWSYQFYVTAEGSLYAKNLYVLDDNGQATQIGGTDGVYLLKSGGTITGDLTVNGTITGNLNGSATKLSNTSIIGNTNKPVYFTANGVPAAISYEINKSVPSNAIFTDENVNTSQANTSQIFLTGTTSSTTATGKLKFDSNVYITTTAGTLHATTFEGNLSGTASRATADGDGNRISATYLKLSGGNVTGAVSFGSSVSADELMVGDLVVNGAASFTNNLQANTINGVEVGASPKFTDTVTTVTTSGNGNAVTAITASNGQLTVTKGTTFLTSYTETDPIFVASAAHGITSSDISNWNSKTSNTGTVTSVRVQATSPLQSSVSTAQSSTLNTTISFTNQNKNLVLAGPSTGSAAAPTFRSLVADDIPGLAWSKITSGKPTTLSGYGITDAVPNSRKVAGHALSADITLSNSDVGLGNVINVKQITNITNEFKDGQNTGKLVIWRGESDSEVLEVQITAREATSATNATNAQYATYDASEASKTTKTTIADKYIPKSIGTAAGDIIYWSASGTPVRLAKGSNGQVLKLANGVPTWGADNNTTYSAGTGLSLTGTTFANTGVTGIKGNAESTYRTGQVNLTPTNLGAVRGNSYLFYGTCNTEAATAEKEVTCADFTSNDLQPGAVINVYFTVTNSAAVANLQLNVNGTGAKNIKYIYNGSYSDIPGAGYIKLNQVYQFTYDGTYWIVQMIYNTDADWRVRADYGRFTAGTTGLLPYALVMQTPSGRWESITTTSTTATTKIKNATGFLLGAIYYKNNSTGTTEGNVDSSWQMSSSTLCDARYHFNIENTTALKLNSGNALYLVGTIENDGLFYLADTWWTQSLPTTVDGKYYIYIGTVFDWYRYNLDVFHPIYKFVNGKVRSVSLDAILVNSHTVNSDVPSNAKFTDTWNALSTSQAGYVTKAPNDTGKFLRGDATWAAVTKANVGLGNVENTALSTWTGTNKITTVGTITTGAWNGTTIDVSHGGTGKTSGRDAANYFLNSLDTGSSTPADNDYYISQYVNGGTTTTTYHRRPMSALWNYISGKISGSGKYVTIDTNQTLAATGIKTYLGLQIYGSNGITLGTTSGNSVTQKANMKYDSTLDAIVFSFA